ncbi:up-regulator of cell proliferation-like [Mantella aurantiaca]
MAYCKEASQAIARLKEKLCKFPEDDLGRLSRELSLLNIAEPQDSPSGSAIWSTGDNINEILNATAQEGESACKRFLFHLEDMMPRFPTLCDLSNAKRKAFCELTSQLGMENYRSRAITLRKVLTIGHEDLEPITFQTVKDVPWFFLRNLMSLNVKARNTELQSNPRWSSNQDLNETDHLSNVHPLDILCTILHCSDGFLQQEIVSKMSMCQFAVPLLLPACDNSDCTFLLWAMRGIVKKWRPHSLVDRKGFMEENIVNISMPIFSFVRLGNCSLSKSAILNHIISSSQRLLPFFMHRNMEGGNLPRKISDGLVEISWYFPACQGSSDVFPEPIMVTNLRGDVSSNWTQFTFLREISAAIFIFVDSISEADYQLLSKLGDDHTEYYFVISNAPGSNSVTQDYLTKLSSSLKINKGQVLFKKRNVTHAMLVKRLQITMSELIKTFPKVPKLENLKDKAYKLGIHVDENLKECQTAKRCALEITEKVGDVGKYKENTMILQGELWKKLADTDKELYRMKKQGDECLAKYSCQLRELKYGLLVQQSKHSLPPDIEKFIKTLIDLSPLERRYFLKWMKILLDSISMAHLEEIRDTKSNESFDKSVCLDMKGLEVQKKPVGALGLEHYIRELAQFYEVESFLVREGKLPVSEMKFRHLPGEAADLLLDGFPLELIDGDASNVPLQWITDILIELDEKTGGQCTIKVITVLGVQSTGKSTLLNTMFGLHFPVASGRCTRGAFMTLIKVKEDFQEELGCHFLLVIDTEGLKAPERMSLEGSFDHDNELATMVVGLSDITIINLSMENVVEMNDILQIVVHAFLRMNKFGRKPNCRFVHQNVSDISAHWNNLRGRKKFKEELDAMTRFAAKMEKRREVKEFADVLDHDLENNSMYIPGLWCGDPPMASVNIGYSENIYVLKRNLLTQLCKQSSQTIYGFSQWLRHLWDDIRRETFIFSFRNSLVASAYDQLTVKYSELQWKFRKATYHWLAETENVLRNQTGTLQVDELEKIKAELWNLLQKEETSTKESLEKYFESSSTNGSLIERYREEFFRSVKILRSQYETQLCFRLEDAIQIHKNKNELQVKQDQCHQIIEDKVSNLLEQYRETNINPNSQMIDLEFTKMWEEAFSGLQLVSLKKHNIKEEIFRHLQSDLKNKSGLVTAKLFKIQNLEEYELASFTLDKEYVIMSWGREDDYVNLHVKLTNFVSWLLEKCLGYVKDKVNKREDYQETYCQDLLDMINKELNEEKIQELNTTELFELDVKLLVLGRAAPIFQTMHDYYIQENDSKLCLERLKPQYFSKFQNIFQVKDLCQNTAKNFCDTCLKPAITEYVFKNLGKEIVDDILLGEDSRTYSSRTFFQFDLLRTLLLDNKFHKYAEYIADYKSFVNRWILKYILNKYKKGSVLKELHAKVLSVISKKIINVLNDPKVLESSDISVFMGKFSNRLTRELVLPRGVVKAVLYQSQASVEQFSSNVQAFLPKMEEEITKEFNFLKLKDVCSKLTVKPEDELFKRVFGCGKQCPFCRVPCEAGGLDHQEHFAAIHRPQGLGGCKDHQTRKLDNVVCTTDILGIREFRTDSTDKMFVPYSLYRRFYPDWSIQPDCSVTASDYWKYVLKEFNEQFAEWYWSKPANIPEEWQNISQEQAMRSLQETFNIT